jgi:ABC-type branched-subunit amino acid transport system ATPase component
MKLSIERVAFRIEDALILDGVTGELASGETVGIVGPNGAGKTTLANLISGFARPSAGKVLLDGLDLTQLTPAEIAHAGVSRMFQGPHLAWNLSAHDNVQAALDSRANPSWLRTVLESQSPRNVSSAGHDSALKLLERVGLVAERATPARDLSFGQQRLLALARSLAWPAKLLLLDEPFTGVKGAALERVLGILGEEAAQGRMILVIDHALSAIQSIAVRVWYMHKGKLTVFSDYGAMADSDLFVRSYLGLRNSVTGDAGGQLGEPVLIKGTMPRKEADGVETSGAAIGMSNQFRGAHTTNQSPRVKVQSDAVLSLHRVSGGYGTKTVVHDINVDLFAGDVFCLLGLNGSGKSTLLRIVAGVASQFSGNIWFEGSQVDRLPADLRIRRGMRFLPQDHRIFRSLSIEENLALTVAPLEPGRTLRGFPLATPILSEPKTLCVGSHDTKGLSLKRLAGTLSGGEQALVALVQVQFGSPKLVMLDEPTSGIDGFARSQLSENIMHWRDSGATVIIVEHDIMYSLSVASRIAVLKDGTLEEVGPVDSLSVTKLLGAMCSGGREVRTNGRR